MVERPHYIVNQRDYLHNLLQNAKNCLIAPSWTFLRKKRLIKTFI